MNVVSYMSTEESACATSSVDRVPGYEPVGRRFESCVARQKDPRKNPRIFLLQKIKKDIDKSIFLC